MSCKLTNTLQDNDPFLQAAKRTPVDLEAWSVSMMERHNRKSHLAPQLSPSTRALLRDGNRTAAEDPSIKSPGTAHPDHKTPTWHQHDRGGESFDVDALPLQMEGLSIEQQQQRRAANGYANDYGDDGYQEPQQQPHSARHPQQYYDNQYEYQDRHPHPPQSARTPYSRSISSQNVPVHPAYRDDLGSRTPQSAGWPANSIRDRRVGFEG